MSLFKFITFILIKFLYCQKLEIKNLNSDPLLVLRIKDCKIQTGIIKIIHPVNLTNLEITIESINNIVKDKASDKLKLYTIVKQKTRKLYENLHQIKPPTHKRHKRWDTLGTAWKWIAGSPDALDLQMINSSINELIDENNKQYLVNEQINRRIELLTDTINKAIDSTTIANRVVLSELEMLAMIVNIDTVNAILEDIQDAIIRTKIALPSNKMLSFKEIIAIKNLLVDQGVEILVPDEALKYIIPKIAVNDETLLYILEVPKLEEDNSTIMMIAPMIVNGSIIHDYPKFLIKSKQKLFTTSNHNGYVQKSTEIKEFRDECIKPLILGSRSHCKVTPEVNMTVHLISEDKLLINGAREAIMQSNCGPDNRTLTGNFVITFWNCTISIDSKEFQSYEWRSEIEEIQGALHNIEITRQMIEDQNIATLTQENIQNRKQLNHVYLRQLNHQTWLWKLSGGISVSTVSIALLVLCIYIRRQPSTVKIEIPKANHQSSSYTELLKEAGISCKDEDALSSPPGGVMHPHKLIKYNETSKDAISAIMHPHKLIKHNETSKDAISAKVEETINTIDEI